MKTAVLLVVMAFAVCLWQPCQAAAPGPEPGAVLLSLEQAVANKDIDRIGGLLDPAFEYRYVSSDKGTAVPIPMDKKMYLDGWPKVWQSGVEPRLTFGRDYKVVETEDGARIQNLTWALEVKAEENLRSEEKGSMELRRIDEGAGPTGYVVVRWISELGE